MYSSVVHILLGPTQTFHILDRVSSQVFLHDPSVLLHQLPSSDGVEPYWHDPYVDWNTLLSPLLAPRPFFPGEPRLAGTRMSPFWILLQLSVMEVVSGDKSSSQIITTNKPTPSFLQAGCPSCRPTNSVKALKGIHRNTAAFNAIAVRILPYASRCYFISAQVVELIRLFCVTLIQFTLRYDTLTRTFYS